MGRIILLDATENNFARTALEEVIAHLNEIKPGNSDVQLETIEHSLWQQADTSVEERIREYKEQLLAKKLKEGKLAMIMPSDHIPIFTTPSLEEFQERVKRASGVMINSAVARGNSERVVSIENLITNIITRDIITIMPKDIEIVFVLPNKLSLDGKPFNGGYFYKPELGRDNKIVRESHITIVSTHGITDPIKMKQIFARGLGHMYGALDPKISATHATPRCLEECVMNPKHEHQKGGELFCTGCRTRLTHHQLR